MPINARKTAFLTLPKPGQQYKDDESIETEVFEITKQTTVNMLKDRLELYGLARDGKRNVLVGRLEEFAGDQIAWRSLFQPQAKRKRGSQMGKRKESHSAKQVGVMFDSNNEQPLAHQYRFEGTHRPVVQDQTQFQEMQLDDWTNCALADCGDANWALESRDREHQVTMQFGNLLPHPASKKSDLGNTAAVTKMTAPEEEELMNDNGYSAKATMRRILLQIKGIHHILHDNGVSVPRQNVVAGSMTDGTMPPAPWVISPGTNNQHVLPPSEHVIPPQVQMRSLPATPETMFSGTPPSTPPLAIQHFGIDSTRALPNHPRTPKASPFPIPPACLVMADGTIPDEHIVTLQLDKNTLTFDRRQVPDPPAQHFSNQISKLFSEWETGTLLQVSGQYIPLKHWPKIYHARAGAKRGVWGALKVEYANWKYLVEEKDRLGSEQAFWATYSKEDGTRLCYQHILNRLKRARADRNRVDADAARKYFGQDLQRADTNGAFQYEKKGKMMVYVKDQAIADAWRKLLARDPVVATRWEAMEARDITELLTSLNIPLVGNAAAAAAVQ